MSRPIHRPVQTSMSVVRAGLALACATFLALALLTPARAVDVPFLTGRVVDNAEILQPATRDKLTAALKAHEQRTSDQVVVLTVPTIGETSVEEYATKVFETWKLGIKGKDNGVLIVIVPQDRKMRIEVGYGLEGTLTDVASNRIIRNLMTPQFKAGNYDKGVEDGVTAVIAQLEGQPAVVSEAATTPITKSPSDMSWPTRILVGVFIFGIIGIFTCIGVMSPGSSAWFLYLFLIPFWWAFPAMVLPFPITLVLFVIYLLGFPIAKLLLRRSPWYQNALKQMHSKGSATIGGFPIMGGGSSGGGGFSGGGGGSGGGGSSGGW
ncbi:MAG: TPM domain-containing protein [Steroidobacteraceae bacterium]